MESILLPYQCKWVEDQARVAVYEKSRRIGISWATAGALVLEASRAADPQDGWYVGYNQDMTLEFIRDCATWARAYQVLAGDFAELVYNDEGRDILSYRIDFASGKRITALSSRPTNLRNKKGIVVIDEAAHHDNLAALITSAVGVLFWGGKVRIMSTHNGADNDFNTLVDDIRKRRLDYSLHRTTLDDAITQGLYRRIAKMAGTRWSRKAQDAWRDTIIADYRDAWEEELFCIPTLGSGAYIPRHLIDLCMDDRVSRVSRVSRPDAFTMRPAMEREHDIADWLDESILPHLLALPKNRRHFLGQDFGRSGDLSVIAIGTEEQNLSLTVGLMIEMANIPFEQQKQITTYLCARLPRFTHAALDATGNGAYLAEVTAQQFPGRVEEVHFSESWYRDHMPHCKARFEDQTILIPKDADVLADLRAFKLVKGVGRIPEQRAKGADGVSRHGDAGIAIALLDYASTLDDGVTIEYRSAGEKRASGAKAMEAFLAQGYQTRSKRLSYSGFTG